MSRSAPPQALGLGSLIFCCEDLDIFRVPFSVSSHLFHMSFWNVSKSLPSNISSYLFGFMFCCILVAFIATYRSSDGVSVIICSLSTDVVEYALVEYIYQRITFWIVRAFFRMQTFLYSSVNI